MSQKPWQEILKIREESPEGITRIDAEAQAMLITSEIVKIRVGLDELNRGESDEWTPALMERLNREADEMYRRGELPDPGVCP